MRSSAARPARSRRCHGCQTPARNLFMAQRIETINTRLGDDHDTATVAAITAVRTAFRDVLLAPKARAAIAPFASVDFNLDAVDEHGGF